MISERTTASASPAPDSRSAEPPAHGSWDLRGLLVIAAAHATSDLYSGLVPLVVFYVVTHAGLSAVFQGLIGFGWYLTSSIAQPFVGVYSDRHGRWWFLPASIALTAVAISFLGFASNPVALVALVALGGLGSAVMHPEAGRYAAMLSGDRKAGGISIFQIGGSVGYALGPVAAASLLAAYGGPGTLALLVPGLIAVAALFLAMRRVAPRAHARHARATANVAAIPVDRLSIGMLVTSTAVRHLTGAAFVTFLPNLLTARGASLTLAGEVVTAFLLVQVIGMYLGGRIADRLGAVRVSVLSLLACVPFLALFVAHPDVLGFVALLVGSVLLSVQNAPGVAIAQAMLPKNLGTALGLMNGVAFGIGSAAVTAIGFIVARSGPSLALAEVSAFPVLAAAAYIVVRRRQPQLR